LLNLLGNHDQVRPITMRLAVGILGTVGPAHPSTQLTLRGPLC
jgi:hypothetical protein